MTINNLKVKVIVNYIEEHFDIGRQDIVGGYWFAQVVTGLEEAVRKLSPELRQKDLVLYGQAFGAKDDMNIKKEAIDVMINNIQQYGFHGTIHIMTEKELDEYYDELETQSKIV